MFAASLRMNHTPSPASAVLPLVDAHVTGPQDRLDAAPPAAACLSVSPPSPPSLIESRSRMYTGAARQCRETKQHPPKPI